MFGKKKYRKAAEITDVAPLKDELPRKPFPGKRKLRALLQGLNHPNKMASVSLAIHPTHAVMWPEQNIPFDAIQATRYQEKGFEKVTAYKKGRWDGYTNLGRLRTDGVFEFPIGLLGKVLQACEDAGVRVQERESTRVEPIASYRGLGADHLGAGITLRDYQKAAVTAFIEREQFSDVSGYDSVKSIGLQDAEFLHCEIGSLTRYRLPGTGLLWAATGSGKTVSSASMIARLGVRTLFMVYGNDLVRQTWRNFNNFLGAWLLNHDEQIGIAVEGDFNPGFVTVAGQSTLAAMLAGPTNAIKRVKTVVREFMRTIPAAIYNVDQEDADEEERCKGVLSKMQTKMATWLTKIPSGEAVARTILSDIHDLQYENLSFKDGYVEQPDEGVSKAGKSYGEWLEALEKCLRRMDNFFGSFKRADKRREELLEYLSTVEFLIVDEAHKAAASGAYSVIQMCPAYYRVGMSGTPLDRADGANLKVLAAFGECAFRVSNSQMRDAGVIPDAQITLYSVPGHVEGFYGKYKWNDLYLEGIVYNEYRNRIAVDAARRVFDKGGKVLMLFKSIEHGEVLGDLLDEAGVEHLVLDGSSKTEARRDALDQFSAGTLRVIVASAIFGTGIDIPDGFDLLALMAGGKGKLGDDRGGIAVLQNLGRGLRGDGKVEVIDFMDEHHRTLYKHSVGRLQIYQGQGCFQVIEERSIQAVA